jgi:hypothetical protein
VDVRRFLAGSVAALGVFGLAVLGVMFVGSMWRNDRQEDEAWVRCDLSRTVPGSVSRCGPASVYRRTEADKQAVNRFRHLLDDANSRHSEQPPALRTAWRSGNPDYLVFMAYSPVRGCPVTMAPAGPPHAGWTLPESAAIETLPYFVERCDMRMWDTSGRLYHRQGYPRELNLIVPETRWLSPTEVVVHRPR